MSDARVMVTVLDAGAAVGAAVQTQGYPLVCNGVPADGVDAVVAELAGVHPELVGVRGVRDRTTAFADAWSSRTGRDGTVTLEERLYRLADLRPPTGVAGSPRLAGAGDRSVLVDWVERFFAETFGHVGDTGGTAFVEASERNGDRFVLWADDGSPVSMAMLRAPAAGVSRIGPVFTPEDLRGHGYGSAVTAAASDLAHSDGTPEIVLFADLANPTSNGIYRRIGFAPVVDSVRIDFAAAE
jgi:GNAT superfamily N-acetyltransferase